MRHYPHMLILFLLAQTLSATTPIQISGTITDPAQKPVSGAVVKLVGANSSDTTDENGNFKITSAAIGISPVAPRVLPAPFAIHGTTLSLNLPVDETAKIELFSINGRLVQPVYSGRLNAGETRLPLRLFSSSSLCILRCRIGGNVYTCKVSAGPVRSGTLPVNTARGLAEPQKNAAATVNPDSSMDMLEIRHPSYTSQKYLLNPYRDSVVEIAIYSVNANWITELDSMYIDQEVFATGLDNGNYMAIGQNHSAAGDYDLCFFTIDPQGSILTRQVCGSADNDLGMTFSLQKDNTVRVFGDLWYRDDASEFALFTMRVSPSGDSLDSRTFSSADTVFGGHGAVTADGGYVIAGHRSYIDEHRGNYYVPRVTRVLADGSVAWTKDYGWPYYFSCNSTIVACADGCFALAGYAYDDTTFTYSIWLLKMDANGAVLNSSIIKNKERPYVHQLFETTEGQLFLLGVHEIDNKDYTCLVRFASDCSPEWDTTLLDSTRRVWCMTPLKDGSFLMAYNKTLKAGSSVIPEEEAIGLLQMKTDGTVVKEVGPIPHFGHPRSIAVGKDNSILISSASGYTFMQQKFFIINIANEFEN